MACAINVGGPTAPEATIPVSDQAAQSVETVIQSAIEQSATTGIIAFTLTEEQVTSYLVKKILPNSNLPLNNPQVFLQDGEIEFYDQITQGPVTANISVILTVKPSGNGGFTVEVTKIDFGPLPVPEGFNEQISSSINQALTELTQSNSGSTSFYVESIDISNGMITIQGRTQS